MRIGRNAFMLTLGLLSAVGAGAQTAAERDSQVYTVATLLLGTRSASTAGGPPPASDGSMTIFMASSSPLTVEQSAQIGEDLASLQEKLKATFQLARIETVASIGAWLSPGREMVLRSATGEQTLVLTGGGRSQGTQPPFVAVVPKGGAKPPGYERGYVAGRMGGGMSANFNVKLTSGATVVFDRPMAVELGQRSVFARPAGPDGALFFVVVAAPLSSADRARPIGGPTPEPDGRIRAPRLVSGDNPLLPAGIQPAADAMQVVLTGTIGIDGRVSNIKVVRAADGLTDLAVAALRDRRYEPARDDSGKAVEVQIVAVVPFKAPASRK